MILYVIRHGETNLNKAGKLQGWIDEPLNENGIELAKVTGEALKKVPFDLVITSPLVRASKTAELVVGPSEEYFGRKIPIIEDKRIIEFNWGNWDNEGCLEENYSIPAPMEDFNILFSKDSFQFKGADGGEDCQKIVKRTREFLDEVIANPEYQDKTILVSSHGFAVRALLNQFYEDKADLWHGHCPYNCEVNIIAAQNGNAWLLAEDQVYYDSSKVIDMYKTIK